MRTTQDASKPCFPTHQWVATSFCAIEWVTVQGFVVGKLGDQEVDMRLNK